MGNRLGLRMRVRLRERWRLQLNVIAAAEPKNTKKHHTLSRTTEYSTQWECECERGVVGDGELNRTQKAHQSEGAGGLATTPLHRRTVFGIAFGSLSCLS